MKVKTAVQIFVGGIIVLAVAMAILGFNGPQIDKIINWFIPIGLSFVISAFVGEWLEGLTGNFFKNIYLSFPIWRFRVNIPLFIILVLMIKLWIFN